MTRVSRMCGSALAALGTVFLWGCAPEPPAADTPPAVAAHPEQALIEDLVVANRILGRELAILDIQGHTTVRSRLNPNHYFIPRFMSPGGVTTSDIIENDLDSNPVAGPRTDQAREIYLHGEIYKARPDVMAIVHAHTSELVAFGVSSVPLWSGGSRVPVWDIRPFNRGRSGIVSTPALGRAMAETLGGSEAVLLWGHGVALTGGSLAEAVSRVDDLRNTARLQQVVIAMGGTWDSQMRQAAAIVDRTASAGAAGSGRMWEYLKREVLKDTGGQVPVSESPAPAAPGDPDAAAARDVAFANRILTHPELGILDAWGHVSMRSSRDPNRYFIAPRVSAGAVTPGDVVQRAVTDPDPDGQGFSVHAEVYKARPDVMAVLYANTPEIVAFAESAVRLRPVVNGGAFIGAGFPIVDVSTSDPKQPILANPALGRGVAEALGKGNGVLLTGHGFVLTDSSVYNLVNRAYALRMNAIIQQQATALRGKVTYLSDPLPPAALAAAVKAAPPQQQAQPGPTGPVEGRAWIYWRDLVSFD